MTAESFGFTHENSVRLSFLTAEKEGHPIGTAVYGIVSNAVPLLLLLPTHTFRNFITWQRKSRTQFAPLSNSFLFFLAAYNEGRD
jgi:hypothetical protein